VIDSVWDMSGNVMTQYSDSFSTVTICSYDPNDKWVSPEGLGNQNYTPPNTELTYTINFQNTGNDTAFNVVITDSLDVNLDWNTFEVISSTHEVYAQMDANGLVTFTFQNILLPDSNVDEPGSHGTVAYQIMTDSLLPDPTEINNTAYIYFDWNPPVITNTTTNTITELQFPAAAFTTGDVSFCPGNCIDFTNMTNPVQVQILQISVIPPADFIMFSSLPQMHLAPIPQFIQITSRYSMLRHRRSHRLGIHCLQTRDL
jgi:uncharacterized repeat protein (TIGR01451 family)